MIARALRSVCRRRRARIGACGIATTCRLRQRGVLGLLGSILLLGGSPARAEGMAGAPGADTAGTALVEWAYDTWTVPWVQVRGTGRDLDPASYATLMTLTCEASVLERERRARHLSAEDCEHHMAVIRADQDTSLIFRVQLKVAGRAGSSELVRMGGRVRAVLEDDHGWGWSPGSVGPGSRLGIATGGQVERVREYRPIWMRGATQPLSGRGAGSTEVEYWIRFARCEALSGRRILTPKTRWLRLRLSDGANEWVATWAFLPEEGRTP